MKTEKNLFGDEVKISEATRKPTPKKGYVMPPGTGPKGETCKSCKHLYRNRMSKTYLKCNLNRANWTGGNGSDVAAKSPACSKWEKKE